MFLSPTSKDSQKFLKEIQTEIQRVSTKFCYLLTLLFIENKR